MKTTPRQPHYLLVRFDNYNEGLILDAKDAATMQDILARNLVYKIDGYGSDQKFIPTDTPPITQMVLAHRIQFPQPSLADAVKLAQEGNQ